MSEGISNSTAESSQGDQSCIIINNENTRFNKDSDSLGIHSIMSDDKLVLAIKLKEILSCRVCLELRRSAMYQCKYGHLICAGCFGDILSESRLQNEIATCPNCQATINKDLCSRNVAVEKTISELPMTCPHCGLEFPPDVYKNHETQLCERRISVCCNHLIGCPWQGPFYEKSQHEQFCKQPSASGYDILKSLVVLDQRQRAEMNLYDKIIELLSVEKLAYNDLQFKRFDSDSRDQIYETSKFTAFENQWLVRACCSKDSSQNFEINYQLILKTKLNSPMSMYYLILRGPYSEIEIKPKLYQFKFTEKITDTSYQHLALTNSLDRERFCSAKRINFRLFMFLAR